MDSGRGRLDESNESKEIVGPVEDSMSPSGSGEQGSGFTMEGGKGDARGPPRDSAGGKSEVSVASSLETLPASTSPMPRSFSSSCSAPSTPCTSVSAAPSSCSVSATGGRGSRGHHSGLGATKHDPREHFVGESKVEEQCIEEKVSEAEDRLPASGGMATGALDDIDASPSKDAVKREASGGRETVGTAGGLAVAASGSRNGWAVDAGMSAGRPTPAASTVDDGDRYWPFSNPFSSLRRNPGIGPRPRSSASITTSPDLETRRQPAPSIPSTESELSRSHSAEHTGAEVSIQDVEVREPSLIVDVDTDRLRNRDSQTFDGAEDHPLVYARPDESAAGSGSTSGQIGTGNLDGGAPAVHAEMDGEVSPPALSLLHARLSLNRTTASPSPGRAGIQVGASAGGVPAMGTPSVRGAGGAEEVATASAAHRAAALAEAVARADEEDDEALFGAMASAGVPQWSFPAFRPALASAAGSLGVDDDDVRTRRRGFHGGRGWGDDASVADHRMEMGYSSSRLAVRRNTLDLARFDHHWSSSSPPPAAAASFARGAWRGGFERSASWRARVDAPLSWSGAHLHGLRDGAVGAVGAGGDVGALEEGLGEVGMGLGFGRGSFVGGPTVSGRFLRGREGHVRDRDASTSSSMVRNHRLGNGIGSGADENVEAVGEACFEAFNVSEDVTATILGNLDARDLARAAAASRGWRRCTSSRPLWAAIYARDFLGHFQAPSAGSTNDGVGHGQSNATLASVCEGVMGHPGGGIVVPIASAVAENPSWSLGRAASASANASLWSAGPRVSGRRYGMGVWSGFGGGMGSWGLGPGPGELINNPKEQYAKQLKERRARLETQQKREIKREARKRADRRRRGYERALDCLHVRLLPPLMGVCLVLTFVFVAAWLDGDLQNWGYWRVLTPVWIMCGVAAVAVGTGVHAWRERGIIDSPFRLTFSGMRGAVRYFIAEVVQDQAVGVLSGVCLLLLVTMELIVVGLQVEGVIKASWFVVFLPLLLCLMIFCVSPCLQWSSLGDGVVYFAAMFAGWLPALLCILLVCARLEGDEISMNLIMAPLWVVNGFLIVVPVWFAIATGCRRLRGGEPVDGVQQRPLMVHSLKLIFILSPIFIFEVLLAVYVEEGPQGPFSAVDAFAPLIFWCCALSLSMCWYACSQPARHMEIAEGALDVDPAFEMAPAVFPTRASRPYDPLSRPTLGSVGSGIGGVSMTAASGGGGFGSDRSVGGPGTGSLRSGSGSGIGGSGIGRNRRGSLHFPPAMLSPVPQALPHAPRPLTPAPHASVAASDAADVIALSSQLAELGAMAGFLERTPSFPSSPSLGGSGPGGGALRTGRTGRGERVASARSLARPGGLGGVIPDGSMTPRGSDRPVSVGGGEMGSSAARGAHAAAGHGVDVDGAALRQLAAAGVGLDQWVYSNVQRRRDEGWVIRRAVGRGI